MDDKISSPINKSLIPFPIKDLTKTSLRYSVLSLIASIGIGSFFIYDNPAVLESQLKSVIIT